jgi:type I restriction enzyme S subunit
MTGRYKAYPEYKDSGIEWLGEIPSHWFCTQIKYGFDITLGKMLTKEPKNESYELKSYLKAINIQPTGVDVSSVDKMWFSPSEITSLRLQKNDLLISEGGDVGRSAIWNNELSECYIQNAINRARALKDNSSKFLLHWMHTLKSSEFIDIICNKATIAHYTAEKVEASPLFLPTPEEQQKIANFLDHETAKIDTLIAKQEKLIELLKEKRQAVISHAVTKGLNPDAPMKDSGVEWLGEVPEHWEMKRFKHLFKIRKRIAGKTGFDILSITQKGIKVKDITSGEGQLSMDYSKYQLVYQGDYAMNHMDLLTGFVDISNYNGVTSPDYRVFTLEHKLSEPPYYLRLLQMGYLDKLFYPLGQGAAHIGRWRLPTEAFNEFLAPCPPQEEQKEISQFINLTHGKVDALLEEADRAVNLMKERKTALISAAVTGKIDVRDWQPKGVQG